MGEQVAARSIKKILDLPVIRKLKRFSFLMTDKTVKIKKKIDANLASLCTLKIAYRNEMIRKISRHPR